MTAALIAAGAVLSLSSCAADPLQPQQGTSPHLAAGSAGSQSARETEIRTGVAAVLRDKRSLTVRSKPSASAAVVAVLPPTTALGSPRVLLVDQTAAQEAGWVRVHLPTRPNGSSGWVPTSDVRLTDVFDRIHVSLSKKTISVRIDGKELTRRVAIGSGRSPTPAGDFYVTDRVKPPTPGGPYGSFALGVSAHSDTLTEFGGGDAQIGIHGTNEPRSIGTATTHGCIRVPEDMALLLARTDLGAPVTIDS